MNNIYVQLDKKYRDRDALGNVLIHFNPELQFIKKITDIVGAVTVLPESGALHFGRCNLAGLDLSAASGDERSSH